MREIAKENMAAVAPLFEGWEESLIWSCLQGHMGRAFADEAEPPRAAEIVIGDLAFLAGDPQSPDAEALAHNIPDGYYSSFTLAVARTADWFPVIERAWGSQCRPYTRYAIRKEPDAFDPVKLEAYVARLPEGYQLVQIDGALYDECLRRDWARDFCSQFSSREDFCARGLGYVALFAGEPVSGASSYTVYDRGLEVQLETLPEHRRKGLGRACAARLVLECLKRGLYPSWDAANRESVALAESLGYHFAHEYTTYFCHWGDETEC